MSLVTTSWLFLQKEQRSDPSEDDRFTKASKGRVYLSRTDTIMPVPISSYQKPATRPPSLVVRGARPDFDL